MVTVTELPVHLLLVETFHISIPFLKEVNCDQGNTIHVMLMEKTGMDFEVQATFQDMQIPQPLYNDPLLHCRRTRDLQTKDSIKGQVLLAPLKVPSLVCTEEGKWVAQSSPPHALRDNRNATEHRAPPT